MSPMPEHSPVRQIQMQVPEKYNFPAEFEQDELSLARQRASKVISEDTILDSRTGRKNLKLENEFDDQVSRRNVCTHPEFCRMFCCFLIFLEF